MAVSLTAVPSAAQDSLFRRQRTGVLAVLFAAYVAYYFGRVTVPTALPLLERAFSFTKTQTGLILSAYYAVYAFSKAVNGILGDRLGGKTLILLGLGGSIVCNAAFGFGRELYTFAAIWGANALFQAMGWLGIVPIMARWYPPRESGSAMGVLSLSYQVGDFLARSVAGVIIATLAWRGMFWAHAIVMVVAGVVVWRALRPSPEQGTARRRDGETAATPSEPIPTDAEAVDSSSTLAANRLTVQPSTRPEYAQWVRRMLTSPWFWTVCIVYLVISIVRYIFWGWSVQYLLDRGVRIGPAALTAAVFPLFGSLGSIFAGWVSDRMQARRGPVIAIMGLCLTGAIFAFSRVAPDRPLLLTAMLGLVGFLLYGPYALMAGAVAIDFGSTRASATAAGIIDAVGAVGAIVTGVGMGYLIDTYGWNNAFGVVVALAGLSALLGFTLWNMRPLGADAKG